LDNQHRKIIKYQVFCLKQVWENSIQKDRLKET
jgi:hypothetical protein